MARIAQWAVIWVLVLSGVGCGKKEAKVVQPSAFRESEVAIWVDQVGITSGQVQKEVTRLFAHVPNTLPPAELAQAQQQAVSQAVDNLVVRQLVRAELERSGMLISQAEIDAAKEDLQKSMGADRTLVMLLAEANITLKDLEDNLRLDIFKNKTNKDKIDAAVAAVTEETAQEYYDNHLEQFSKPEGPIVSHILVSVPANADEAVRAERRAKIEGIHKALLEGAEFEALARETSDCLSRNRGGNLGVIPKGREDPNFEQAAYHQPVGEIGDIVESNVGFHVIKVTGEQEAEQVPFEGVKDQIVAVLKSQAQQKITSEYMASLRDQATIKLDGPLAAGDPNVAQKEPTAPSTSAPEEAAP